VTAVVNWAKGALRISGDPFIVLMVVTGAVLLLLVPRWGRRWVMAFAVALWFCSTPVGSGFLAAPLARGFHSLENRREAGPVGAIVVLGGGSEEARMGPFTLSHPSRETALRTLEGVRVFRLLDGQPLVVASGGMPEPDRTVPEGEIIAADLVKLRVPLDHVLIESRSTTTREQAMFVTELLQARGIRRFVLVTSPTHMWRSVLVFRAQGADPVPSLAPLRSDMKARRFFDPSGESLQLSDEAVYDYASTAYYWWRGWFRPAPAEALK
jgi:uncharacterized SAM-binding protein YcdF (DUF218 family)